MFDRIEDTRADETKTGIGLTGQARIPGNKAHRFNVVSALQTKMASTPSSNTELFGAPKGGNTTERKTPKVKKELTPEEQAKKDFEKEMQQTLVTMFSLAWLRSVLCLLICFCTAKLIHVNFFAMVFLGSRNWPTKPATPVWIWPILVFCTRRCAPWIFASDNTCAWWALLFHSRLSSRTWASITTAAMRFWESLALKDEPYTSLFSLRSRTPVLVSFLSLWGWIAWSSRGTIFLPCKLDCRNTATNWRIVWPSCHCIENCITSATKIILPAGCGKKCQGCGYHCAVAWPAFRPYTPVCCLLFSLSKIIQLINIWLDQGIKAEKRKAEEKANPKKKAKAKGKAAPVKDELKNNDAAGNVVGVHPDDLDEEIFDDDEEEEGTD